MRKKDAMIRKSPQLQPAITLAEIYPPETIFCVRGSYRGYGWYDPAPISWDRMTASSLTLAGTATTICARAAATERGLQLLESAGLPPSGPLLTYGDAEEFAAHIKAATLQQRNFAYQMAHAPRERPTASYYVPRRLLTYLNNKGNLAAMVPDEYVPQRITLAVDELIRAKSCFGRFPIVLKAVSPMPSGSALAVRIARCQDDLLLAQQRFAHCDEVVAEEFLEIRQNFCLNFATTPSGTRYLGASQQVTDRDGGYFGNWLEPKIQPPAEAIQVGWEIMRRATNRGYHGPAGFDMTIDSLQKIRVIDLNFRLNGSTAALVWHEAINRQFKKEWIGRVLRLNMRGPLADFEPAITDAIKAGILLPLGFFDTAAYDPLAADSSVTALVLGNSRSCVLGRLRELSRQGLVSKLPNKQIRTGQKHALPTDIAASSTPRKAA
jgi:hypothetical protein